MQGPRLIGKTRLLEECLDITPRNIQVEKIVLSNECSDNKVLILLNLGTLTVMPLHR